MFPSTRQPIPAVVASFGAEAISPAVMASTNNIAAITSGTWGTANRAVYCPFRLNEPLLIQKVAIFNGSSATGNIDVGVYSENGTKIWSSGSTAQSGTNAMQVFTPTAFRLPPGRYYMAAAFSSLSGTITGRQFVLEIARICGFAIEASAFPLPATATFAVAPTTLRVPLIVLSGNTVV